MSAPSATGAFAATQLVDAYRVVSGLNGAIPKGQDLHRAISLSTLTTIIGTGQWAGSPPAVAPGKNPSYGDMAVAVLRAFATDKGATRELSDKQLVLNYADFVGMQIPEQARAVIAVLKSARGLKCAARDDSIARITAAAIHLEADAMTAAANAHAIAQPVLP